MLIQQILLPEGLVGGLEVSALIAPVAVHAVGVDHQLEGRTLLLQHINELQRVLEVDVVVPGTVGYLQHHTAIGPSFLGGIIPGG